MSLRAAVAVVALLLLASTACSRRSPGTPAPAGSSAMQAILPTSTWTPGPSASYLGASLDATTFRDQRPHANAVILLSGPEDI